MPDCIKCGSYTRYNGGLCSDCYYDNSNGKSSEGSRIKRLFSSDNMIKGRIAETIIEELFQTLGFKVYRFGMENTIPAIMEFLSKAKGKVAMQIRRMPDFIVYDPKSDTFSFIEVKFRASGNFRYEDLGKEYPYDEAFIIIVSTQHIKCLTVKELKEGKQISANCKNYLGYRSELTLDKEVIKEFCELAVKFFISV